MQHEPTEWSVQGQYMMIARSIVTEDQAGEALYERVEALELP
jgi:hypothetical protein